MPLASLYEEKRTAYDFTLTSTMAGLIVLHISLIAPGISNGRAMIMMSIKIICRTTPK